MLHSPLSQGDSATPRGDTPPESASAVLPLRALLCLFLPISLLPLFLLPRLRIVLLSLFLRLLLLSLLLLWIWLGVFLRVPLIQETVQTLLVAPGTSTDDGYPPVPPAATAGPSKSVWGPRDNRGLRKMPPQSQRRLARIHDLARSNTRASIRSSPFHVRSQAKRVPLSPGAQG